MAEAMFPNDSMLGRFRLEGRLGAGGMGEVYRATDTKLGRRVAIKVLPGDYVAEPVRLEQFEREARAASALHHPNIVTVFDAGVTDGTPWIAMEYVEGRTLREMLAAGPLAGEQLLGTSLQLANGLSAAHEMRIIHRDLKPENVMVTKDGVVKILDFGLAKLTRGQEGSGSGGAEQTQTMTLTGGLVGTPAYMSPEQIEGAALDYRSDQFSLGVILYELATGLHPFRRPTAPQTMAAILEARPKPPAELKPGIPATIRNLIPRCLARTPGERFDSTREIVELLRGMDVAERPVAEVAAEKKSAPRWVAAAALAAVAVAAGVGGYGWLKERKPTAREAVVVAVRGFQNLSGNPANDYISSGIAEDIRAQLSRIASIRLLSAGAVGRYRDGESRRMAEELGVGRIVEGSIRVEEGRLRVSAQLTDAKSEQLVWSEQYERPVGDLLALQSDLARQITMALQPSLTPDERRRVGKGLTENFAAYELFLQARRMPMGDRAANERSIALLKEAVALDPRFSEAMALISQRLVYMVGSSRGDEALQWAQKAVEVDPESSNGHYSLGMVLASQGYMPKSRVHFLKALELDPNSALAMTDLAVTQVTMGRFDEGLHWARLSLQRHPQGYGAYSHVLGTVSSMGDRESTLRWLKEFESRFPGNLRARMMRVFMALEDGKTAEALEESRQIAAHPRSGMEGVATLADVSLIAGASDAEEWNRKLYGDELEQPMLNWVALPESPRVRYALLAGKRGAKAEAEKWLAEAEKAALARMGKGVDSPFPAVELAAVQALRNDADGAMKWLQTAFDRGWRHAQSSRVDPMLANVRKDARFEALMKRIDDDLTLMRQHTPEIRALFEETLPSLPRPAAFAKKKG